MEKTRILIVDDDPDILDVLEITLSPQGYELIKAKDGLEALELIKKYPPHLIIVDYKMPRMTGIEVCKQLKHDLLLSHLPVIMLTGKGEVQDKVEGIEAGADDYVVKPFEPQELLARIKMSLRRTARDLEANPLTRLPGNNAIMDEIQIRIDTKQKFAVCYIDLDLFKSYNDKYGFERGDEVIRETARIIIRTVQEVGGPDDFIGHIGGDDFVVITTPERAEPMCQRLIRSFEETKTSFYAPEDLENGYIMAKNRQGHITRIPLLSVSIGVVSNEYRSINHVVQVGEIGAELKEYAKSLEGSNYVKDQRKETPS